MLFITVTSSLFAACYFDAFLTKIICLPIEEQYKCLKVESCAPKLAVQLKGQKTFVFNRRFSPCHSFVRAGSAHLVHCAFALSGRVFTTQGTLPATIIFSFYRCCI